MQHAVLNVRQDLRLMLERRRQADPTVNAFDLLILIRAASDCWNCLQAAVASNNYYFLDVEVDRVAGLIQNMAEAMRTLASLTAPSELRRPGPIGSPLVRFARGGSEAPLARFESVPLIRVAPPHPTRPRAHLPAQGGHVAPGTRDAFNCPFGTNSHRQECRRWSAECYQPARRKRPSAPRRFM